MPVEFRSTFHGGQRTWLTGAVNSLKGPKIDGGIVYLYVFRFSNFLRPTARSVAQVRGFSPGPSLSRRSSCGTALEGRVVEDALLSGFPRLEPAAAHKSGRVSGSHGPTDIRHLRKRPEQWLSRFCCHRESPVLRSYPTVLSFQSGCKARFPMSRFPISWDPLSRSFT